MAQLAPDSSRFEGCLLGLMTGDCLGLPREGLSPERAGKLFGSELEHRFILGRGMASDDTELACFAAQSFLACPDEPAAFARALAWKLRLWFLGLPAGIGLATLRAILKLWAGFAPESSGVRSAGNGPAIRAPVIGLVCWDDLDKLESFTLASTRLTHTDPRAERAALAAALAARYAATHDPHTFSIDELWGQMARVFPPQDAEAQRWLALTERAVKEKQGQEEFSRALGFSDGVSGTIYHTLPAVLWAWLLDPFDYKGGLRRIILLGGDADTTGAIFGALCGASAGVQAIPREWLEGIIEFPRTVSWVRRLAQSAHRKDRPLRLAWPLFLARNPLFLAVVLFHGFRRLLPPY